MPLLVSLPASAEGAACQKCSWGAEHFCGLLGSDIACRQPDYGRGSRERRHGAALESLAQRIDALGGVGAIAILVEATELIARQAAREKARER